MIFVELPDLKSAEGRAYLAAKAAELHAEANRMCFIANSVSFPVHHEPVIRTPTGPVAG